MKPQSFNILLHCKFATPETQYFQTHTNSFFLFSPFLPVQSVKHRIIHESWYNSTNQTRGGNVLTLFFLWIPLTLFILKTVLEYQILVIGYRTKALHVLLVVGIFVVLTPVPGGTDLTNPEFNQTAMLVLRITFAIKKKNYRIFMAYRYQ